MSICFNYKEFEAKELCTKLYHSKKLLVGYGSFKGEEFVRFVTINAENKEKDILRFFQILEKYADENHLMLKKREFLKSLIQKEYKIYLLLLIFPAMKLFILEIQESTKISFSTFRIDS